MCYDIAMYKRFSGFTLIEVLVVLAIVGILLSAISFNFTSSRIKSENRAFMSEFKQAQLAIELYKSQYGEYPPVVDSSGTAGCTSDSASGPGTVHTAVSDNSTYCRVPILISGLVPDFIDQLPAAEDAPTSNCVIRYYVDSDTHARYKLMAERCIGAGEVIGPDHEFAYVGSNCDGTQDGSKVYDAGSDLYTSSIAVYSAGAECY